MMDEMIILHHEGRNWDGYGIGWRLWGLMPIVALSVIVACDTRD
jgi:hypothetical protein